MILEQIDLFVMNMVHDEEILFFFPHKPFVNGCDYCRSIAQDFLTNANTDFNVLSLKAIYNYLFFI